MTPAGGRIAAAIALFFIAVVYAPGAGRGFVKDDVVWIATSRIEQAGDLRALLRAPTGFYRPVVSLSFAANEAVFALHPLGYGVTNVAILFGCIAVVAGLLRTLGLGRGISAAAAIAWALNFHGINMAVLWISGRTALWLTLFATGAAWAWQARRVGLAAVLAFVAMASREDAYVLPVLLTAWAAIDRRPLRTATPVWGAAALALALRFVSDAYTPASAPAAYRYQFTIEAFTGNVLQYADRTMTTPAAALLLFWLIAGAPRPPLGAVRPHLLKGLVWVCVAFAATILLPVRSSLYAVWPSVGVIIAAGALLDVVARTTTPQASRRATVAMLALMIALYPAYHARSARYVREAELSAAVLREVAAFAAAGRTGLVVVRDARDERPTAEQAFGPLADEAAQLVTGGRLRMWIDPPPAELASRPPPGDIQTPAAVLTVAKGRLVPPR